MHSPSTLLLGMVLVETRHEEQCNSPSDEGGIGASDTQSQWNARRHDQQTLKAPAQHKNRQNLDLIIKVEPFRGGGNTCILFTFAR